MVDVLGRLKKIAEDLEMDDADTLGQCLHPWS